MTAPRRRKFGFTLIELLVALAIFSLVAAMAAGTFWSVLKAWNRGGELLEQLHYGEFAMEQLVTAMRGAAWFPSKPSAFGFWLESDKASWVTSGTAFLPPDSPYQNGLHRISVTADAVGGERGLVVRAWPHLSEDMDENDAEPWLVCPGVDQFKCEWYDFETDAWSTDWEETNSLPKLVRFTLKMEKRKNFDEELELQRLVELEVAPDLPGRENRDRTTAPVEETPAETNATDKIQVDPAQNVDTNSPTGTNGLTGGPG
jgi:prepilin-type N-terminal cleavage/methylation domain-containing protein